MNLFTHQTISNRRRGTVVILSLILLLALTACGGETVEPTATTLPPTWTPTPFSPPTEEPATPTPLPVPTDTPLPPPPTEPPPVVEDNPVQPTEQAVPPTEAPPAEPTATPFPRLVVSAEKANLRSGPGTNYQQVGSLNQGAEFAIIGRNNQGDWWQILVNTQPMWIFNDLVDAIETETVQVAQNIPAPPPRPTQPPPPPTNTPAPVVQDPCAGIGGDGCKFRVGGGPAFAANGGTELKLTLAFVHSGRGNEAQGSYFMWLEKDGAKLPVSDGVRSWTGDKRQGANGAYNYEYKLGLGDLPGNTVAGCYVGWVLDGNGERDSQNVEFCVPEGQGEVWIKFDQS